MGPRKKSKPNPPKPAAASSSSTLPSPAPAHSDDKGTAPHSAASATSSLASIAPSDGNTSGTQTPRSNGSRKWLGGSWRSKAPASVQTSQDIERTADAAQDALPTPSPSPAAKFLAKRKSSKGDALPAAVTSLNVDSNGTVAHTPDPQPKTEPEPEPEPAPTPESPQPEPTQQGAPPQSEVERPPADEPPLPPEPSKVEKPQPTLGTFGWRYWWSRPDGYSEPPQSQQAEEAQSTPLPATTPSEESRHEDKAPGPNGTAQASAIEQDEEMKDAPEPTAADNSDAEMKDAAPANDNNPGARSSWFWLWTTSQNAQASTESPAPADGTEAPKPDPSPSPAEADGVSTSNEPEAAKLDDTQTASEEATKTTKTDATLPPKEEDSANTLTQSQSPKPTGWAFWFKGNPKTQVDPAAGESHKQIGEVAVYDTPSQSHPEAAQFNEQEQPERPAVEPPKEAPKEALKEVEVVDDSKSTRSFRSLRGRPKAKKIAKEQTSESAAPDEQSSASAATPIEPETAASGKNALKGQGKLKAAELPPNLLLPEFDRTYHLAQKPNLLQRIRKAVLGGESFMPHLQIERAPPRIHKAVAIGVHGFFPAPLIQRVLGQPTGTSIRFATHAKQAIDNWTEARGYTADVEQIALEGEGTVSERVNTLWKLLLNWIDHIKAADFILVACHSQGVPVATILVSKLIHFGVVESARIGICAMAGINMGPFIEYRTPKYFGPTAAELFEFSNPRSMVSQMYLAALHEAMRYGVRILYVGSIDDQLVSLEVSNTFHTCGYLHRPILTWLSPELHLLRDISSLFLPRRLHRWPSPRTFLPDPPCRLRP